MPEHLIRYDLLTQEALRGVLRRVLADVARAGTLPGEHHFYITFNTRAPGARLSTRLRAEYPDTMTIVLQHQYSDLAVTDAAFEVRLSFHGVSEKLHVPFDAVTGFFDPSVQFGLQFEQVTEGETAEEEAPAEAEKPAPAPVAEARPSRVRKVTPPEPKPGKIEKAEAKAPAKAEAGAAEPPPDKPSGGAEVVRLDRFRKK